MFASCILAIIKLPRVLSSDGANDAPKFKDYILPLIFAKRRCDVFDDEWNRIAKEAGARWNR